MVGDDNEVLAEADRNMLQMFSALIAVAGGDAPVVDGPLTMLASGSPISLFNPAFVHGAVDDAPTLVDRVRDHYRLLGLPFILLFRDDVTPGLAGACEDAGMTEHWRMPLMVLDPIPADAPAPPAGLEIRRVEASDLTTYIDVLCAGFGMPRELMEPILRDEIFDVEGFTGLIGLLDGQPVSSSALYVSEHTAGVYNVATVDHMRGKGIGAALTWAAVMAGRDAGATRSVLQASQMGQPVYRDMGYSTPDRYRQFEPAAASTS